MLHHRPSGEQCGRLIRSWVHISGPSLLFFGDITNIVNDCEDECECLYLSQGCDTYLNMYVFRMSSDIVSILQLDKELDSRRLIVAKEINGCDSTFLISCVLGHCIKNKTAIFIISTHNSQLHFQNVGVKINYNLQKHIDSGLVNFYNAGEQIVNSYIDNQEISLDNVFLAIKDRILTLREKYGTVNVIVDGVSHFFDMQYSLRDVNKFCKDVISLCRDDNSFIFFHTNVVDDEVTTILSNLLSYKAHTVVSVESLSSGWSADISGHLTVTYPGRKFETEHMNNMDIKPSRYLFKLFDRGVKLFAPGTV